MQTSVVRGALRDSRMGLAVSTPGLICTFDRLVGKIIPADAMMGAWELIRHI